jgi:hypothetical protein
VIAEIRPTALSYVFNNGNKMESGQGAISEEFLNSCELKIQKSELITERIHRTQNFSIARDWKSRRNVQKPDTHERLFGASPLI